MDFSLTADGFAIVGAIVTGASANIFYLGFKVSSVLGTLKTHSSALEVHGEALEKQGECLTRMNGWIVSHLENHA